MKIKSLSQLFFPLALASGLIVLSSCGTDDDDEDVNVIVQEEQDERQEQQDEQGVYTSTPAVVINNEIETEVEAESQVVVEGDEIVTRVEVENAPQTNHRQYIHRGSRCPTSQDDVNRDGHIDEVETQRVVGAVLISLDANPEVQEGGESHPRGSSYSYFQRLSLSRLLAYLRAPDENPDDEFGKLPPEENLNLAGRTLVIYGTARTTELPATVSTVGGGDRHERFPICCSVIQRQEVRSTSMEPAPETVEREGQDEALGRSPDDP